MVRSLSFAAAAVVGLLPGAAAACGCFTPPDPTVPVVQAGERILFAVKDGQVTAHVQVLYQGNASEFGWLLPLPSVPTLELGIDELFTQLTLVTQPKYRMNTVFEAGCQVFPSGGTGGGSSSGFADAGASSGADAGASGPLVVQDSIGPYDYAVLRADSKAEMLQWLTDNRYFVPAGTDQSVAPYIRPGAFFLALKLQSGQSTGDLQPIVLRYPSDVGMIPITLTSTGATENMGVQVWMLGSGRAIPRNYHHTVLNDAAIDWRTAGSNYEDVIIRAVAEAPRKHAFVTEYSGTSTVMSDQLAPSWRFGAKAELAGQPTRQAFDGYLFSHGFLRNGLIPSGLKAILDRHPTYQPAAMADEIWERIVEPTRAAQALFAASPTLTRLYTKISPADMNEDPAFSFNPTLPGVSNVHEATMHVYCDDQTHREQYALLVTEQGWTIGFPNGRFAAPTQPLMRAASLRIEVLSEEGPPETIVDNTPVDPKRCGCGAAGGGAALALAFGLLRRRRRC